MRFDYLILAHDAFGQLERLIHRLLADAPEDRVVLHVDARSRIPADFLATLPDGARARVVQVARRVPVRWAHWSQCRATLTLLDAACADRRADHLHLLSGRDWPLVDRATIVRDIERAGARDCFVEIAGEEAGERMQRFCFEHRWLGYATARPPLGWRFQKLVRRLSTMADGWYDRHGRARSQPLGRWVKGSQWWSLPADAADHARAALRLVTRSGRLRFTQCSDEHVVPTALLHSRFADRLAPTRRFLVWEPGAYSPKTLRGADLAGRRDAWFARKFDAATDDFFYAL